VSRRDAETFGTTNLGRTINSDQLFEAKSLILKIPKGSDRQKAVSPTKS
jgi:hypothetical protein